jgi:hypothetical protein
MPSPQDFRRTTTPIFAVAMFLIGIALIVEQALRSNWVPGVLLGVLFALAGAGRLYVARKTP